MAFEENDGQLVPELSYLGRARSYSVAIERDRLKFFMPAPGANATIDVRFAGSRGGAPVSLSGVVYRSNYFIGADPSLWREGVANFSRVGIRGIYPGIDTEFYDKDGALEHDFIVSPGADANSIRLDLLSTQHATLSAEGDAIIPSQAGELRFRKPVAYQFDAQGKRVAVDASYRLKGNSLRFALGSYDRSRTLVIDPVIVFATYLAGVPTSNGSTPTQMGTDGNGNLYLAGTTTSAATDFPAAGHCTNITSSAATCTASAAGTTKNIFVAALVANQLGSSISWITLLGGANDSIATSVVANSSKVYVAGTTGSSNFPGVKTTGSSPTSQTALPTATSVSGIIASLNAADGTLPTTSTAPSSQYIVSDTSAAEDDKTTITGLALDGSGNVYVSGYGLGNSFTKAVSATSPINPLTLLNSLGTATAPAIPAATATSTNNNAFVIELDPTLQPANAKLVTYLQSTAAGDYRATAIQVNATGQIYVAGTVGTSSGGSNLQFPSAKSFASATPFYTAANDFDPNGCVTISPATRVFLAQIQPASGNSVLGFSLFTCGGNTAADSETALGLAIGASGAYLVGSTTAPDLFTGVSYSLPSFAAGTSQMGATFTGGLQPTFAGTIDGYAIKVPLSGSPLVAAEPSAFTYLGGTPGSSQINAVAIDDTNHLLQLAGQTSAARATMPTTAGASGLPPGVQDQSGDTSRGFLYSLDDSGPENTNPFLTTVKSISYLGNTTTNSAALSVLPDVAGAGAYVLGLDTVTATAQGFMSADAIGVAANGTKPNSYIADIQGTNVPTQTPANLTFTAAGPPSVDGIACTPGLCEIAYNNSTDFSTITYTWNLNLPLANAQDLVLNFPAQGALPPGSSYTITSVVSGATLQCVFKQNSNGTTCVFPSTTPPSTVDAGSYTVTLATPAEANQVGQTINFDGNAADANGEYSDGPQQAVNVVSPVLLALNLTQNNQTTPATFNADDGTNTKGTQVTYVATVQNSAAGNSTNTQLSVTLPPATIFKVTSAGLVSATGTCTQTSTAGQNVYSCTGVTVAGNNGTATYTVVGYYLGAGLDPTGKVAGPFPNQKVTAAAQSVPISNKNQPQSASVTATVNGLALMNMTVAQPAYPGGTAYPNATTAFNLGAGISAAAGAATPLQYTVTIANTGPNAAGLAVAGAQSVTLANVLPQGFTASAIVPTSATGATATCTTTPVTACSNLFLPSGSTLTLAIQGGFFDTPTPDATPKAAVSSAQQNFSLLNDQATLSIPSGTFDPNATAGQIAITSPNVTVQRLVHLKLTVAVTSTPTAPTPTYTPAGFNLDNAVPVVYTYTLENDGPDYAINVQLGSAETPPGTYLAPPTGSYKVTTPAGVTCTGAAPNPFTACQVANIPPATSPTYAFNVLYPDLLPASGVFSGQPVSAVPGDAPSALWAYAISTPWTATTFYPNAFDSNVTASTAGSNQGNTTATIYRTSHLKITLTTTTAPNETTPSSSFPNQPGYHLGTTVNYSYVIENDGPDAAIYVPVSNAFTYVGAPPAGYVLGTGVTVSPTNSGDLSCPTFSGAGLYTETCTLRAIVPGTPPPGSFVVPVSYPDTQLPLNTSTAGESLSSVPSDVPSATYNDKATITAAAYNNSVDGNPAATTGGSNISQTAASIYRVTHLKIVLNSGTGTTFNLKDTVPFTYKVTNAGPNVALNVKFNGALAPVSPPAGFVVQPTYFTVPTAPTGNFTCAFGTGNTSSNCMFAAIGTSGESPAVDIASTENLPPAFAPTQPDFSAVPSAQPSLGYSYAATPNNIYSNAIDGDTAATAAGDSSSTVGVTLNRLSPITVTPAVSGMTAAPPCLSGASTKPCFYMVNTNHLDDTGIYTVDIANAGPNAATNATLTIALPNNFAVPDANSPAPASSPSAFVTSFSDPTTSYLLQCTPTATASPANVTCTGLVPKGTLHAVITSQFNGSTVPLSMSTTVTGNTPPTQNSVSSAAQALQANVTQQPLPPVSIYRAAHLITIKSLIPAPGNQSPNGFALPIVPGGSPVTAVNLDEKTTGDIPGKNDLVQIIVQAGNSGLNDAPTVVVTETLPPYFILTRMPDPTVVQNCSISGPTTPDAAGNPMTGPQNSNTPSGNARLTCTFINPVPHGTGTASSNTTPASVSAGALQFSYYGKFQDNGRNADIISLTQSSVLAQASTAMAMSQDVQNLDSNLMSTMADLTSPVPLPIPVMRAAHVHFTQTQYVQPGDAALNPVGGVSGPGIAEAQQGTNGGEVINPVRYQVKVTNDGPNIATDPIVSTTLPLNPGGVATKFVNVAQSIEPSSTPGFPTVPSTCAGGQACQDAGLIVTGASVLYNVDGNFDLFTLTEGNSGTRTFAAAVASSSVVDSNPAASTGGDQQTSLPITVVNTPAGANFKMAPYAANLTAPVNLNLGTVQIAGITGLAVSGSSPAPAVPMGPSPNPPDNGATKPLYRFGTGGLYYMLGTTASVPTAMQNSTQICMTQIPDVFEKPERVLLWALANAPAGTTFNTVPNYTNNGTVGDITVAVLPLTGGSYTVPTAITSYPPPVQAQPALVCGVLNGLPDAANPTTLAVLEPVNYAPYIRTTVAPAASSSQPGKGVTASAAVVDLTISPKNNYDYNDQDPCYTGDGGTQRSTCNDNVQLTTFLFGGQNFIGDTQQQYSYFYGQIPNQSMPQFNIPAGLPQIYVLLTDQVGAQHYQNVGTDPTHPIGCDPGTTTASYTPAPPFCTDKPSLTSAGVTVPPVQAPLTDNPTAQVALVTGSIGFGGSTGLIVITETPEAIAHITAGQTAGFVWNSLTENPLVQGTGGNSPPVFTLACVSADGTNLTSAGITCNVPQTYTYSTGSGNTFAITQPPTVYVVTSSNTAVGALHEAPLSRDMRIVAAIVFPVGAIPLILLLRRRKALKLSGWLAVLFLASLVGLGIGCGGSSFKNMGGTTTTATPPGTYELMVTATSGSTVINSPKFAVAVSAVQ